ncbi:MAG: glycoside hydrolase family 36 N-terminal domain-containing protein, partial [Streptococcus sp.]
FRDFPVITRSHLINNQGSRPLSIEGVTSLSLDLPDRNYEMIQLSGAWARERHIHSTLLRQGIQSIESTRGISSHLHNPFIALKRPETTENQGSYWTQPDLPGNSFKQKWILSMSPDFKWESIPSNLLEISPGVALQVQKCSGIQ